LAASLRLTGAIVITKSRRRPFLFFDSRSVLFAMAAVVALVPGRLAAQTSEGSPTHARGQDLPPKPLSRSWQIEYEFGLAAGMALGPGRAHGLPAPGPAFSTLSGSRPSRRVHSWYFGDGAALLNEVLAAAGRASQMTPLDDMLMTQALDGGATWVAGFRVVRGATRRVSIEAGVDLGPAALSLSERALAQVEAVRASFVTALGALFDDPRFINPSVESSASIRTTGGYRVNLTGAVRLHIPAAGRLTPYVVVGGGGSFNFGQGPSVSLTGRYTFMAVGFGSRVWDEMDQLIVRYQLPAARLLAVAGGGLSYELDRRRGIVFDGRFQATPNPVATVLEARPVRATGANGTLSTLTLPSIQFSSFGASPSSLGLNLAEFSSHSGAISTNAVLSVRYYVRY
jgi:hypothetical protein